MGWPGGGGKESLHGPAGARAGGGAPFRAGRHALKVSLANFWTFSTFAFPGIRQGWSFAISAIFGLSCLAVWRAGCGLVGVTIFLDGVSLRGAVGWRGFSCSGASLYWSEVKNAL